MFKKILIANRGEIAVRIIRACKELSIKSAAIYSEADNLSFHPKLADEAFLIGEAFSKDSYLNKNKIINLAKEIKADAIHPGYGFLSENSEFIEMVEKAGINFIGPSSKSVKLMGSKTEARKLMKAHKVPIVPGTTSPITSLTEGKKSAEEIGFPILLKASAGGGGKGMRKVSSVKEFQDAFESTKREALKSFSDDSIYIEKFIEKPKHIEVQIIADKHGNYLHLFERECSIQRRHQKIIEEAPSIFIDEKTREKITTAAINAAKACNYFNAGTIEFLVDSKKNFYFLEMNTRLQVEHPVTEFITGVDLVKEQISVAWGNDLSFKQNDLKINGHSIECRIYAEDASNNFFPSTGKITEYFQTAGPGVRVDSGFGAGSNISIYYDPMIAKLIVWDKDRNGAISRMKRALDEYKIGGVITNNNFLKTILSTKEFQSGKFDINFIENKLLPTMNDKSSSFEDDDEKAAAVGAVLFKLLNKSNGIKNQDNKNPSKNYWIKQLYE